MSATPASFLPLPGGGRIAYVRTAPQVAPAPPPAPAGVIFCPGLLSNMQGTKALALEAFVKEALPGYSYLRFDYRGHGLSSGAFVDTHLGDWFDDALAAVDRLTEGPQIVVGSSMGGLIALHLALRRPDRVAALVLVAPAVGLLSRRLADLSEAQRAALAAGAAVPLGSDYVSPGADAVRAPFFEAAAAFELPAGGGGDDDGGGAMGLLGSEACPVRILHGCLDDVVPVSVSEALVKRIPGGDVALTVAKDGNHRLSAPRDLEMLTASVAQVHAQQMRHAAASSGSGRR